MPLVHHDVDVTVLHRLQIATFGKTVLDHPHGLFTPVRPVSWPWDEVGDSVLSLKRVDVCRLGESRVYATGVGTPEIRIKPLRCLLGGRLGVHLLWVMSEQQLSLLAYLLLYECFVSIHLHTARIKFITALHSLADRTTLLKQFDSCGG